MRMSLQALITLQIALQVCMGLQIISGREKQDLESDSWLSNLKEMEKNIQVNHLPKDFWGLKGVNNQKGEKREDLGVWKEITIPQIDRNEKRQGGGPPPVLQNLTSDLGASCSCGKVLLSSLGPAANFQPQAMGTYTMAYTSYNNHPSYRQNYGRDFRLYFAQTGWLIGDNRGAPTGYIHNADQSQACPYTIPSGWMFYSAQHGAWYPDNTLVLRCITP